MRQLVLLTLLIENHIHIVMLSITSHVLFPSMTASVLIPSLQWGQENQAALQNFYNLSNIKISFLRKHQADIIMSSKAQKQNCCRIPGFLVQPKGLLQVVSWQFPGKKIEGNSVIAGVAPRAGAMSVCVCRIWKTWKGGIGSVVSDLFPSCLDPEKGKSKSKCKMEEAKEKRRSKK